MKKYLPRFCGVPMLMLAVLGGQPGLAQTMIFSAPESITESQGFAKYRLSRSTNGQLQVMSDGSLALAYFQGETVASPAAPNRVWFRAWDENDGWGDAERLDSPPEDIEFDIGGRHPSLAQNAAGDLFTAWHDHRDATQSGNFIDNLEIYGDIKLTGESFDALSDVRLTDTTASMNTGDNGYLPRVTALPDGRWALTWYDFHWNAGVSEICLRLSETDGSWPLAGDINNYRLTNGNGDRIAADENVQLVTPDVVADGAGRLHVCWTTNPSSENEPNIYYGVRNADNSAWVEDSALLKTNAAGYFDPADVVSDPATGDIWMVYSAGASGTEDVFIRRRGLDETDQSLLPWDAEINVSNANGQQYQPDLTISEDGIVHIAYVDRGAVDQVLYHQYDPETETLSEAIAVTTVDEKWRHPVIASRDSDKVFMVFEDSVSSFRGHLYFAIGEAPNAADDAWLFVE